MEVLEVDKRRYFVLLSFLLKKKNFKLKMHCFPLLSFYDENSISFGKGGRIKTYNVENSLTLLLYELLKFCIMSFCKQRLLMSTWKGCIGGQNEVKDMCANSMAKVTIKMLNKDHASDT